MTVFVGPSIWRSLDVRTATATFSAIIANPTEEKVIWAPLWNDALIGRSRSIMCTEFLKTDADVMVIIDDDIVFEASDFWKIVEGARDTHGVYGGAYVTRSTEPHISSRSLPDTGPQVFEQTPQRRPIEYQYLATGFWAVHRDVMEAMIQHEFEDAYGHHRVEEMQLGADRPFYPFFSPFVFREDDGRLHYLSEDWAFSNRARQCGFKVWVDLSIILLHMGLYPYSVRDLQNPGAGFPSTGIDVTEITGNPPEKTGDPLIDNVIADIAEWSDDDPGDIRRMCEKEVSAMALNKLWLTRTENEADWYKREDVGLHYLTDLAGWHSRGGGIPQSVEVKGGSLLDFGAGIGTFALRMAREGTLTVAVEINPVLREFIEWRAEKYGIKLLVTEAIEDVIGTFDAVACWHVYEHIENPEALLDTHLDLLNPNGVLITDSGFKDASCAQHHVRTDWDQVLASRGLEPLTDGIYRRVPARELVGA